MGAVASEAQGRATPETGETRVRKKHILEQIRREVGVLQGLVVATHADVLKVAETTKKWKPVVPKSDVRPVRDPSTGRFKKAK